MRKILRYTSVIAAAALLYLGWTLADRFIAEPRFKSTAARMSPPPPPLPDHGGAVKILQFYASSGVLTKGGKAILCYGVANAKALRIEPAVERLSLSPNRCFEIAPERDTRYTLIAEGASGTRVSESFLVQVKPAPVPAPLPRIVYFENRGKQGVQNAVGTVNAQSAFLLCFSAENIAQIAIDPPAFPPSGAIQGCFYVAPEKETTYTLTATGREGRTARKQLTVQAP